MELQEWVSGSFQETDTDYQIAGRNILYKNEIEFLPKGVELLCKKIKPKSVLEFGFGMGWTATEFQKQGVQRHVILEPNKENYQMALEWKKQFDDSDIEIIYGFSSGLSVIDIKTEANSLPWDMIRGNLYRTGFIDTMDGVIFGDVNIDGSINILDIVAQINHILDYHPL